MAAVLMSTSCCKDDPIVPDPDEGIITLAELNGSWDFISYTYNGTEYDCGTTPLPSAIEKGFYNLVFDKTNMDVTRTFESCAGGNTQEYDFTKTLNTINFDDPSDIAEDIWFVFTVLSYDGTELKLRIDQTSFLDFNTNYLSGTLTLVK